MKIITALKNPIINKKLKEIKEFEIICNDIQYQDGIIEIMEKNEKIDLAIISEILPGELKINELINKIRKINEKIEIIVILKEKNEKTKNHLISIGIFNIFYNNEITIEELIKIIKEKNNIKKENEINEEIKKLKKIILENNKKLNDEKREENKIKKTIYEKFSKINKNKFINIIKKSKKQIKNKNENKVISIAGANGVGKSVFASILTKIINNKKIILIDFDIFNESLNTNFGTKKYPKKAKKHEKNIFKLIIKLNKKVDLLFVTDLLFNDELKTEKNKIKNILEELSKKYDLIIIDTTSECFFDYTKEIFENSNLIIFLTEPNLLQLKKTKKLLEIYINKWKINKEKINIIINKKSINSIDNKILKILFSDFKILGELTLNNKYDLLINNNLKNININKKIKKEFNKIIRKMEIEKVAPKECP